MSYTLKSDTLSVTIETPGEQYRGSRFDWNGTVTKLNYKNIPMLGEEKSLFKRNKKIFGRGLHNEFGNKDCIGYEECDIGEFFPKIGTGWLKKDENPYFFYTPYDLEKLTFSHEKVNSQKAVFNCVSGERNGYAYSYEKKFELVDSVLTIDYRLENTGDKTLSTTEYCHNFLLPCGKSLDNRNTLSLSWFLDEQKIQNKESICGFATFDGQNEAGATLFFTAKPFGEFYLGGIYDAKIQNIDQSSPFSWTLRDSRKVLTMSESVSFIPDSFAIWGHKNCISPELFFRFSVEKGDSLRWQRRYELSN